MFDILSSMSSLNGMKMDEIFRFEKQLTVSWNIFMHLCFQNTFHPFFSAMLHQAFHRYSKNKQLGIWKLELSIQYDFNPFYNA